MEKLSLYFAVLIFAQSSASIDSWQNYKKKIKIIIQNVHRPHNILTSYKIIFYIIQLIYKI